MNKLLLLAFLFLNTTPMAIIDIYKVEDAMEQIIPNPFERPDMPNISQPWYHHQISLSDKIDESLEEWIRMNKVKIVFFKNAVKYCAPGVEDTQSFIQFLKNKYK